MFDGLLFVSLVGTVAQLVKEASQPVIPAENWANQDLYYKDLMSGMPVEQRMKNVKNGRYKLTEKHPEPHRNPINGKIIIENCKLYREDVKKHGAVQAQRWVTQGKYNLSPEELEKQHEERKKKYEYLYSM